MTEVKKAFFRFEASFAIGAGHAMRSCVIADALVERGWDCQIITSVGTYDFIKSLERFKRIEPDQFYDHPINCDLLVVDNYDLDKTYEQYLRPFVKKILVIDDLANRLHDCDILMDQAYGRVVDDYKPLVPELCTILTGSAYALIRKEFIEFIPKSFKKRNKTTEVKRILVSVGASDPDNYTLKILKLIKKSNFSGMIDVVLGFSEQQHKIIEKYVKLNFRECIIHVNPKMPKLIYEADLAIGGAGSSVWERSCLGLPQYLAQTAENQKFFLAQLANFIYKIDFEEEDFLEKFNISFDLINQNYLDHSNKLFELIDSMGIKRVVECIEEVSIGL